jgi:hypothetical protein
MAKNKKYIDFRGLAVAVKQGDTVFMTVTFPKLSRKRRKPYLQGLKTLIVPDRFPAALVPNKNLPNQIMKEPSRSKGGRRIKVAKGSRLVMSAGLPSLGRRR